jgi:hypothetical protein
MREVGKPRRLWGPRGEDPPTPHLQPAAAQPAVGGPRRRLPAAGRADASAGGACRAPLRRPGLPVGDKVMQVRNNYDKGAAGVLNGWVGVVTAISLEDGELRVLLDEEVAYGSTSRASWPTPTRSASTAPRAASTPAWSYR